MYCFLAIVLAALYLCGGVVNTVSYVSMSAVSKFTSAFQGQDIPQDFMTVYFGAMRKVYSINMIFALVNLVFMVLYLIAGIKLFKALASSRKLLIITAGIDIGTVIIKTIIVITLIVPAMTSIMGEFAEMTGEDAAIPMGFMGKFMKLASTGGAIVGLVLGSIIPILIISFLSTQKSKEQFESTK